MSTKNLLVLLAVCVVLLSACSTTNAAGSATQRVVEREQVVVYERSPEADMQERRIAQIYAEYEAEFTGNPEQDLYLEMKILDQLLDQELISRFAYGEEMRLLEKKLSRVHEKGSAEIAAAACSETDDHVDLFVQGAATSTNPSLSGVDYCYGNNLLYEYYCDAGSVTGFGGYWLGGIDVSNIQANSAWVGVIGASNAGTIAVGASRSYNQAFSTVTTNDLLTIDLVATDVAANTATITVRSAHSGMNTIGTFTVSESDEIDFVCQKGTYIINITTPLANTTNTTIGTNTTTMNFTQQSGAIVSVADLNTPLPPMIFEQAHLSTLENDTTAFGSQSIGYYERITVSDYQFRTSLDAGLDDYVDKPWLEVSDGGIVYEVVFSNPVPLSGFTANDLDIPFAGRDILVTDVDAAVPSITIDLSESYALLSAGDVLTVDGRTITIVAVGANSVLIDVDGQTLSVSLGQVVQFSQANNFEVEVTNIMGNFVSVRLGQLLSKTFVDGDALEIFDGVEDADDATWRWEFDISSGNLHAIQAVLNIEHEDYRVNPDDDERNALDLFEGIFLPNAVGKVDFSSLKNAIYNAQFADLELEFFSDSGANVLAMTVSPTNPVFEFASAQVDEVRLYQGSSTFWYEDAQGTWIDSQSSQVDLRLHNQPIGVVYLGPGTNVSNSSGLLEFQFPNGDRMEFLVANTLDYFGSVSASAEQNEFSYFDAGTNQQLVDGVDDELYMTTYGVIIDDIESQLDFDEVDAVQIPYLQVGGVVSIWHYS